MVTYQHVVEAISKLQLENPRSSIEDNLEVLADLESHGFDVNVFRDRLTGLLSFKEKQHRLQQESKKVNEEKEAERIEGERLDKEIEVVGQKVVALHEKHVHVLKKKEKKDKEVAGFEADLEVTNQELSEVRTRFDELAAAPLVVADR